MQGALAALKLASPDRATRLAAAKELAGGADDAMLPLVRKALDKETDPAIKTLLAQIAATLELKSGTKESRIAAIRTLADSSSSNAKTLLLAVLENEKDEDVRLAARDEPRPGRGPARVEPARGARLRRHLARLDPAARRARARHHLRPDGRHQHGARRADHDRRLRHLRGAEPVPRAPARRVRLVSRLRGARFVPRRRPRSAWCSSARSSAGSTAGRSRRCSPPGASA